MWSDNLTSDNTVTISTDLSASEVKYFTWKVKHFKDMYCSQYDHQSRGLDRYVEPPTTTPQLLNEANLVFDSGHSLSVPSKWEFYFVISTREDRLVGINLRWISSSTNECAKIFAKFEIKLKNPNNGQEYLYAESHMQSYSRGAKMERTESVVFSLSNLISENILVDNCLTLHIRFEMFGPDLTVKTEVSPNPCERILGELSRKALADNLQGLLDSGNHSDVIIQMKDGKKFKVHKAILISQSRVFLAMFESQMSEATLWSGVIHLDHFSSEAFGFVLNFIYSGTFKEECNWKDYIEEIVDASEMYELISLKKFCDQILITLCTPENAVDLLKLAKKFNLETGFKQISDYVNVNLDAVTKLLENIPIKTNEN